jgi:hypothetical protein
MISDQPHPLSRGRVSDIAMDTHATHNVSDLYHNGLFIFGSCTLMFVGAMYFLSVVGGPMKKEDKKEQ